MKNILPILWEKLGPPSFCVTNYVLLWGYHLKIKHLFFFFFPPNSIYMEKKIAQKNSVCESSQFCLAQQGQGRQSTQLNTKRNSPLQLEYFYFLSTSFLPFFFLLKRFELFLPSLFWKSLLLNISFVSIQIDYFLFIIT